MATRAELVEWMDSGAYHIIQPGCDDAGVTECWCQARMGATRGKLICPHNWQDGLVCVPNAHLIAAVPNRFMLESNMTPNPLKEGLFKQRFGAVNGYFEVPQKPGLGVELKEGLSELSLENRGLAPASQPLFARGRRCLSPIFIPAREAQPHGRLSPIPEGHWNRPDPDMPPAPAKPPGASACPARGASADVWPSRPR